MVKGMLSGYFRPSNSEVKPGTRRDERRTWPACRGLPSAHACEVPSVVEKRKR